MATTDRGVNTPIVLSEQSWWPYANAFDVRGSP